MKRAFLMAEGLADEPVAELQGRTPLEAAKAPHLARLAKEGRVGAAQFTPHELPPTSDVAALAALGYDPLEHYTGRAPLEALAAGVKQGDAELAFRCDFVTVLDDVLVDPTAGAISARESKVLAEELNRALGGRLRLHPREGHKNLLVVNDAALSDELDELESVPAERIVGEKLSKHLPKGRGDAVLRDFLDKARALLEQHEINRIRIDLKENPANSLWAWGQGKPAKLPRFEEKRGLRGAVVSPCEFVRGLGLAAGLAVAEDLAAAIAAYEFVFAFYPAADPPHKKDLKSKVRQIEAFDRRVVGPAIKAVEAAGGGALVVTTDNPESLATRGVSRGKVPFVLWGAGPGVDTPGAFGEKAAAQSKWQIEQGWRLMDQFLSKERT